MVWVDDRTVAAAAGQGSSKGPQVFTTLPGLDQWH